MTNAGGLARVAGALLLVGAVLAGCGSSTSKTATTESGVTVAPDTGANATATTGPTQSTVSSATATAVENSTLTFADTQLQSLDGDIGTAQAGVSAQEADPTK